MALSFLWVSAALNAVLLWFTLYGVNFPNVPILRQNEPAHIDAALWNEKHPIDLFNASAVFNTVHGAMKQKDCNVMPVGVSFIPAYIPPNTLMYHSRGLPDVPQSFEWIAMDWEFSYSFAGFTRGKLPHWGKRPKKPPGKKAHANGGPPRSNPYLFTFRNTKPLDKLIYLEGASAAKTRTGEMDQQAILSGQDGFDHVNERIAAERICKWGKDFGLQGYIRLEVGFEMVLCDFFDGIEVVSNVPLSNVTVLAQLPEEKRDAETPLEKKREKLLDDWASMKGWDWGQAGALVNEGDDRILLDFSRMVTPHNRTWINPDPYLRRISNLSESDKAELVSDVRKSLLEPVDPFKKTDWQVQTKHIEEKFAPLFLMLKTAFKVFEVELLKKEADLGALLETVVGEMSRITYNFVRRYASRDITDDDEQRETAYKTAVADYAFHTFPLTTSSESLIYSSIHKVTAEVVGQIFDAFYASRTMFHDIYVEPSSANHEEFRKVILQKQADLNQLMDALRWTIFIQCNNKCAWDELCYAPTWGPGPFGWGANDKYMYKDGDRYRIPEELSCIKWNNLGR